MSCSQRSQAQAPVIAAPIFHQAAAQRLAAAQLTLLPSSSRASLTLEERTQVYSSDNCSVLGECFEVDFNCVSGSKGCFVASRSGYCARHLSALIGGLDQASIWQRRMELEYKEDNRNKTRLWLCKRCHLSCVSNNAKKVDTTTFIKRHIEKRHEINPSMSYLPETSLQSAFESPFEAAAVAGAGTVVSHSLWQEDALQSALVNWVIAKDVSFANAPSQMMHRLLTWN
jgi:hypothetical protein